MNRKPDQFDVEYEGGQFLEPNNDWDGYLYVVEIVGVGVKFGITRNPHNRIRTHQGNAQAHNTKLGRIWLSVPHQNYHENEQEIKDSLHASREYVNASFEDVLALAKSLTKIPGKQEEHEHSNSHSIAEEFVNLHRKFYDLKEKTRIFARLSTILLIHQENQTNYLLELGFTKHEIRQMQTTGPSVESICGDSDEEIDNFIDSFISKMAKIPPEKVLEEYDSWQSKEDEQ